MILSDELHEALEESVKRLKELHQKPAYYSFGCPICAAICEMQDALGVTNDRDISPEEYLARRFAA